MFVEGNTMLEKSVVNLVDEGLQKLGASRSETEDLKNKIRKAFQDAREQARADQIEESGEGCVPR